MPDAGLQTEFEFTLPRGYVDENGDVHTEGRMRLATAADEIQPLNDPRVQENNSYLTIVLLSRVVTQLGTLDEVTPEVIESLFVTDLAHLQGMYERLNNGGTDFADVADAASAGGGADAGSSGGDGQTDGGDPEPEAPEPGTGSDTGNR